MPEQIVPVDPGGGNTRPPLLTKKKQISPAIYWCFTWNNYPEDWQDLIVPKIQSSGLFGCQPEVGENGTPHIQGWCAFSEKLRPLSLGLPKKISWRKMKGTVEQNVPYCSKDKTKAGDYITNRVAPRVPISMAVDDEDIMSLEEMYPWGRELVERVSGCLPDKLDRTVLWYWSKAGQMKKTETARHLVYHHDACVIQGGRKHVLAVAYKNPAPIYILTVPRTDEGFVSYASIELLKDALYMSAFGTECTGSVNRKKPWVVVFANFAPEKETLSEDRWEVHNVDIVPEKESKMDYSGWFPDQFH